MKSSLKQELTRHRLLLISMLLSIGLLVTFLTFQYYELKVLNLDIKWIILSGIPILIGLFVGGYIKSFKGFGLELESNLKEPIPLSVVLKIDMTDSPGINKQSLELLYNLTDTKRNKINRLRFINGKSGYYDDYAIQEHYRVLSHLIYIEIVNTNGEFQYLIHSSKLRINNELNYERITQFIRAIETENIEKLFPDAISDFILTTDTIIDAYKKITKSHQSKQLIVTKEILPILNEKHRMIGTVDKQSLEKKITEEVIKNID